MERRPDRSWEYLPDTFGGVESISDAHVIREQGASLLTDRSGNVPDGNSHGLGLYCADTRHLSTYDFRLNGSSPVILLSTSESGYSLEQVLGNHRAVTRDGHIVGRCTVELTRQRFMGEGLEERLRIVNYNPFPVTVRPSYHLGADFADTFDVRGHERSRPGHHLKPEVGEDSIRYGYVGLDGLPRGTLIAFDQHPEQINEGWASFAFDLEPRQAVDLRIKFVIENKSRATSTEGWAFNKVAASHAHWRERFAFIHTDNEIFNKLLDRCLTDLRMLWTLDEHANGYFAAGTPWFDALFGRDSIITALSLLAFRPDLSRECLFMLARRQGQKTDPYTVEEPGKILHEVRHDELSNVGELPYGRYYGSVDSTPLFLLLAGEYFSWTGDLGAMRSLRPSLNAALAWVRSCTSEHSGYLTYDTDSPTGLRNQGWKDSENGIVHEDGTLCSGPIALAEVQGYLHAAFQLLAPVYAALGHDDEATRLRWEARALRRRFRKDFWVEHPGIVPLCIDGAGTPAAVMSSNAGQVLWGRILDPQRAVLVRDALFSNHMFTGWGIRTLTSENPVFNPLGYHLGTIWPHDNAIIAAGLKRYGFDEEVVEIATALFDTARAFESLRLPEVYGGQPRSMHQPPVPYPVACRPQAWAAASMPHVLQSLLGLAADAAHSRLYVVRPRLPYWLDEVRLRGIRVGHRTANLTFTRVHGRTRVHAEAEEGLEVAQVQTWPKS